MGTSLRRGNNASLAAHAESIAAPHSTGTASSTSADCFIVSVSSRRFARAGAARLRSDARAVVRTQLCKNKTGGS